jgi:hypothetical protein
LPPVKLAPDAVVLDTAFVRLPIKDQSAYDEIWQAADELALPAELRRTLALNGLRVGRFGQQLPARLRIRTRPPLATRRWAARGSTCRCAAASART